MGELLMKNVVIIGFINEDMQKIGQELANKLDFYYLDIEKLIEYSLGNKLEMENVCGLEYLKNEEKKIVYSINSYERTVVSISYETFINNLDAISSSNVLIYLRQTKMQFSKRIKNLRESGIENENLNNYLISEIAFEERDKLLKKNCNFAIRYDISKLNDLISNIENYLTEQS